MHGSFMSWRLDGAHLLPEEQFYGYKKRWPSLIRYVIRRLI